MPVSGTSDGWPGKAGSATEPAAAAAAVALVRFCRTENRELSPVLAELPAAVMPVPVEPLGKRSDRVLSKPE